MRVPLHRIVGLALVALATVAAGEVAAQTMRRVLHVCDCPPSMIGDERTALLAAFARLGYSPGRNLQLESHDFSVADDSFTAYFTRELAAHPADLVLASGVRAAQGAKSATTRVPVVFWRITDPLGLNLVATLARPGANLTGFSRAIEKLGPKRLELLHEMVPAVRRVGFVFRADDPSHQRQSVEARAAGAALALDVRDYSLPASQWSEERLDALFARMRAEGVEALMLPALNVLPQVLVGLAAKHRFPTVHSLTHVVTDWGGLAAYATEATSETDVVDYADRILKGARPADLPVQEPTRFELVLNGRAARALGLTFPKTLLLRASQIVNP